VKRDVQVFIRLVEHAVNGRRVGLNGKTGRNGLFDAVVVRVCCVGGYDELVSDLEGLIDEDFGFADGEADGVAVPVVVGLGGVANLIGSQQRREAR